MPFFYSKRKRWETPEIFINIGQGMVGDRIKRFYRYRKMKAGSFFKYVEIQTKSASMIPFLAGTLLAVYRYQSFDVINFILMFLSLLTFDMTTTAINNYVDYKKARKKSGYGYESHNAIVRDNISESAAKVVILILISIAILSGWLLFVRTNFVVLVLGSISFAVGVLYSAGPVPISRTPGGEVYSGLFMGFLIPFVSIYIHAPAQHILFLSFEHGVLSMEINLIEVFSIFLYSIPAVMGIANIMLANNICDMKDDLRNRRYTLPLYIGRNKALIVFKILYVITYGAVFSAIITGIVPIMGLLFFLTLLPVWKNIRSFMNNPSKKDTFPLSVYNFIIMNLALIVAMLLGLGFKGVFYL